MKFLQFFFITACVFSSCREEEKHTSNSHGDSFLVNDTQGKIKISKGDADVWLSEWYFRQQQSVVFLEDSEEIWFTKEDGYVFVLREQRRLVEAFFLQYAGKEKANISEWYSWQGTMGLWCQTPSLFDTPFSTR